jgi:hypothetical protein
MPNTFVAIQTITVTSATVTNVDFTSIPQTYTDLKLLCSMRNTFNGTYAVPTFQFNGGGQGNVYSQRRLLGSGSGTGSDADNNTSYAELAIGQAAQNTASIFGNYELNVFNYTGTSNNKSWSIDQVSENNATEAYAVLWSGVMLNTSAITSIKVLDNTGAAGNIVQYSTFTLYGIKNS